jgi:hypothetical protein
MMAPMDDQALGRRPKPPLSGIRPRPLAVRDLDHARGATPVTQGDRRDLPARAALVGRIRGEFLEMPGLSPTLFQAKRLFDLREDICTRILDGLIRDGTLKRDGRGQYRRAALD